MSRRNSCRGHEGVGWPVAGINFLKIAMQEGLKTCLFGNRPGRRSHVDTPIPEFGVNLNENRVQVKYFYIFYIWFGALITL